jgi:hypothetical protein
MKAEFLFVALIALLAIVAIVTGTRGADDDRPESEPGRTLRRGEPAPPISGVPHPGAGSCDVPRDGAQAGASCCGGSALGPAPQHDCGRDTPPTPRGGQPPAPPSAPEPGPHDSGECTR